MLLYLLVLVFTYFVVNADDPKMVGVVQHKFSLLRPDPLCKHIQHGHRCPQKVLPRSYSTTINNNTFSFPKKVKVLVMGDSVIWQMWQLLECMLPPSSPISFDFQGLHVFPETESIFIDTLNGFQSTQKYDIFIISIGMWYNWDWNSDLDLSASSSWTLKTLEESKKCPDGLRDLLFSTNRWFIRGLTTRARCKEHLLGLDAYVSGLKRLSNIAKMGTFPLILWKDLPPQHWNGSESGQYEWGTKGSCASIPDKEKAYSRNRVADTVLENSVLFARTWPIDVNAWDKHNGKQCTHYCNPSMMTIGWVLETLRRIETMISKK
jgi:hypothetical protein